MKFRNKNSNEKINDDFSKLKIEKMINKNINKIIDIEKIQQYKYKISILFSKNEKKLIVMLFIKINLNLKLFNFEQCH